MAAPDCFAPAETIAVPTRVSDDLDEYVAGLVSSAPPLSLGQVDRLRGLLTPAVAEASA